MYGVHKEISATFFGADFASLHSLDWVGESCECVVALSGKYCQRDGNSGN